MTTDPHHSTLDGRGVRAVARMLDVVEALRESPDGAALGDIAAAAGLPKSSAFRYLLTLEGRGYVERASGDGHYRLGPAFVHLRPRRLDVLVERARPLLQELRDRFRETVNLGVLEGTRVAYLEILESPKPIRFAARPGERDPIHSTALGKAIAAQLPETQVRKILAAEGMPARTSRTITDADEFLRAVDKVKARGYALDDGENEEDGCCVAVGISGAHLAAAISVSAPAGRFSLDRAEEVAGALLSAAQRLTGELERAGA